ncbi:Hypothetical protein FKW44_005177, partial [Caligus rogercresseyi]
LKAYKMNGSRGSQRSTRVGILKLHAHGQNISQIANALGCTRKLLLRSLTEALKTSLGGSETRL